jgi:RNA polymerase sigma-70 factor, ECF subfamily
MQGSKAMLANAINLGRAPRVRMTNSAEHDVKQLLPIVYEELKRIARSKLMAERANHTLSPTALVHEAWLKLRDAASIDHSHFLALAARAMRQVLVNHALATNAQKRGATRVSITAVADLANNASTPFDLIALDQCLQKLEQHDPRAASLAELRAFAGMSLEQAAEALSISIATAKRDWQYTKLWLLRELSDTSPAQQA